VVIALKIEDIRPRDDKAFVLGQVERFLDQRDPDARVDLKLKVAER
jgi:hypothetical protein